METPQAMPKNVQIGCLDTTFAISYSYNIISTKKNTDAVTCVRQRETFKAKKVKVKLSVT